jgi:hypothetical protein
MALPFFMRASWFKKQGYKSIDKIGMQILLWKPFEDDAVPPRWIRKAKDPDTEAGKVTVTAFLNGWCPAMNTTFERARKASSELGDKVLFRPVDTFDRQVLQEWGVSDALYIDDKQVRTGPPPSYDKIKKKIARRVKKLN